MSASAFLGSTWISYQSINWDCKLVLCSFFFKLFLTAGLGLFGTNDFLFNLLGSIVLKKQRLFFTQNVKSLTSCFPFVKFLFDFDFSKTAEHPYWWIFDSMLFVVNSRWQGSFFLFLLFSLFYSYLFYLWFYRNKSEELIAQLNETINHLRDLAVMVEDFPEGAQEQFNDKMQVTIKCVLLFIYLSFMFLLTFFVV